MSSVLFPLAAKDQVLLVFLAILSWFDWSPMHTLIDHTTANKPHTSSPPMVEKIGRTSFILRPFIV